MEAAKLNSVDRETVLEQILSGRLQPNGEYVELATSLFVSKLDIQMAPLPPIALYSFRDGKMSLLRQADQPFPPMALAAHRTVWVKSSDFDEVVRYAQGLVSGVVGTPMPIEKRIDVLHRSATLAVEDMFADPSPKNLQRGIKLTTSLVHTLVKNPSAFPLFNKLSSHDAYTAQHSIGTAVNCVILGRKLQIRDVQELCELGVAGLIHDIGKVKVKVEIINKPGPLDEVEWEEMRQHATEGFEIVKSLPGLSERAKRAILEHHEDRHGTGYPNRLKHDQLDLFSRIVGMSDIFNALTTNRTYSSARSPFEAFQLIRDKLLHKVDEQLLRKLIMIYGGDTE